MQVVILSLVPGVAFLGYGLLLLATWQHGWQRKTNRHFGLYLLSMMVWSLGALMMYLDRQHAPFWNKIMLAGLTGMPLAFFAFVHAFRGMTYPERWLLPGLVYYLVLLVVTGLGYMATDVHITSRGLVEFTFGPAVPLFGVFYGLLLVMSIASLVRGLRETKDFVARNRIKYVFLGLMFVFLGGSSNVIPQLSVYPVDIAANGINALLIAYAIFRYQLLDISFVIRKGLVYTIPTLLISVSYLFIVFLSVNLLHWVVGIEVFLLSLVVAAAVAVVMQPLRERTQAWVDRFFFREKYDINLMFQRLSYTTASVLQLDRLTSMILDEIAETMHIEKISLLLKRKDGDEYVSVDARNLVPGVEVQMRKDNPIVDWLSHHMMALTRSDVHILPQFKSLWGQERIDLDRWGAELFVPLTVGGDLIGILILGPKRSETPYTPDDHINLMTLANQTAIAIENARLYQTVVDEKERAEIILQQAFAGIIVLDQALRIVTMNPSAESVTGYAARESRGKRFIELFGPEMWEQGSPLYTTLETGQPVAPIETVFVSASGRRDVLLGVTPVSDGFLLNFTDITRLKEIDRLKSSIVASVSHELRTPLTSIKGYTDLMLEGFGSEDEKLRHQFLTIINNETDRLTAFINDLLDLARLESGRTGPVTEELYLDAIITESVRLLQVQAQQARVTIHVDIPQDLPVLRGSRQLMISVVKNLIGNAIKFSLEGGDVEVSAWNTEDAVMFDVIDHGIGIPPEDLPHLFSKFYRSQAAWKSGIKGTGLGLALAKEAVEVHHGAITVESQVGSGSRFMVTLPLANNNGNATEVHNAAKMSFMNGD